MTKYIKYFEDPEVLALYRSPDHEKLSEESAEEMFQEAVSFWLNIYRKRLKITQADIAKELHISQPGVCQMLQRPATVSKLWRLCMAMGGELEVNVKFGDKTLSLLLGDDPLSEEDARLVAEAEAETAAEVKSAKKAKKKK